MRQARTALQVWDDPVEIDFSDDDPVLVRLLPNAPAVGVRGGDHLLQETKGDEIAQGDRAGDLGGRPLRHPRTHSMTTFTNKVAVVTGAGSGIGRALALALARERAWLALNDVSPDGLAETERLARAAGARDVLTETFSVADRDAVFAFADAVADRYKQVDVVVNNAGIALDAATVEDVTPDDFRAVMDVNFWGVVWGSQAFLPHLEARPRAALANVSSIFGITGIALQAPYCASKFAVRGFTESLRMEARAYAPHLTVTTVHPGGIATSITRNARSAGVRSPAERERDMTAFERGLVTSPETAAEVILTGIRDRKERVLIGTDARQADALARLMPQRYTRLLLGDFRSKSVMPAERPRRTADGA